MASLTQFVRIAGTAIAALIVCSPMLLQVRPRTPLRVFCIAAFEYLGRLQRRTLGKQRRLALAHACDFGSLRDEYYDERKLDRTEYRSLRSTLRRIAPEAATFRYIQELRQSERGRPDLTTNKPGMANAIIIYRAAVIDLSLRWLQNISGLTCERVNFHALVSLVCLMQLADDLLDWKDDQAARTPTYVTAFLPERPRAHVRTALRTHADILLQRTVDAARQEATALPFAFAGAATWIFVIALLKVRLPSAVQNESPARNTQ